MNWLALGIYLWAGVGYACVFKMLTDIAPHKSNNSDLQNAIWAVLLWPVMAFVFAFYEGKKPTKED